MLLCYYLQVGVLYLEKVNSQFLLYELTRAIGEDHLSDAAHHLDSLAKFAKETMYSMVHELKTAAITGGGAPIQTQTQTPHLANCKCKEMQTF